jgi:glycosyltransferase involved in cell wall biosynthesis
MDKISSSVIIPAYNAQETIDFCLDSLIKQKDLDIPLEIIIVDDGSTDGTVEHIKYFQRQDLPNNITIRLLQQEKNQGPAAARNRGAKEATGDILLFTDADCVAESDWVKEMLSPFKSEHVSAVKGAYKTKQPELVARLAQAEFDSRYELLARQEKIDVVFTYAAAIKKSVFWEVGGFDTSFPKADNEDTDLSYKIAKNHTIIFNPKAIIYHQHPASLKEYLTKKFSRGYWRMHVYKRFPEKAMQDSYTPQSLKLQILLAYLLLMTLFLWPFIENLSYVVLVLSATFFISTLPFLKLIGLKNPDMLIAAPPFIFLRAVVIGAGIIGAIPRLVFEGN